MSALLFVSIRALHVLLAAIWIGSTVFVTVLLMPAVEGSGASGGEVMRRLIRGGVVKYMAILGGTTGVTGVYLLWRATAGFDPAISASPGGMAFGIGGVAGILAAIIGGSVVGRSATKAAAIMDQVAGMPSGAAKDGLLQQAAGLRQRMKTSGNVVIVLQVIALVLMAVGHYI
jgi:hypothetical protein